MDNCYLPERFEGLRTEVINNLIYNSFYLPDLGLHFIATPKAACTAFKWWLIELHGAPVDEIDCRGSWETTPDLLVHDLIRHPTLHLNTPTPSALDAACADMTVFRFAFVRNPYTRVFSGWLSKLLVREPDHIGQYADASFLKLQIQSREDLAQAFEAFLLHLAEHEAPDAWLNPHWMPQTYLLQNDRIDYHLLAPIERLDMALRDLDLHLRRFGRQAPELGRFNENIISYSKSYLTPTAIQLVKELYAQDFDAFGYDPEEIPVGLEIDDRSLSEKLSVLHHMIGRNKRFGEIHERLEQLVSENSILESERSGLESERSRLESERSRLASEIDSIKNSRSWRLMTTTRSVLRRLGLLS